MGLVHTQVVSHKKKCFRTLRVHCRRDEAISEVNIKTFFALTYVQQNQVRVTPVHMKSTRVIYINDSLYVQILELGEFAEDTNTSSQLVVLKVPGIKF